MTKKTELFGWHESCITSDKKYGHGWIELIRRSFMKGFILFVFCLLSLGVHASEIAAQDVVALKTHAGKIIRNLSLQESTKVLESLEANQNIELRAEIIYPEEVSELVVRKLTKGKITEKRPNPKDYN